MHNHGQNLRNSVKKPSKIGQDEEIYEEIYEEVIFDH